ncbi:CopD family protein [Massilia rhizosphaerae]|uniref:CopD family protein n=1 Tax=Massilia rhizosphaerae TaxID=2784389 RepID=UPI0018DDC5B2|nr:CopD family protein [Massilia rhizosphaerae]
MPLDPVVGQRAAAVVLHGAVAVCAAASLGRAWLARGASDWAAVRVRRLGRWAVAGAILALLAQGVVLWLQAAVMADVPPAEAAGAIRDVLVHSRYGIDWSVGAAALAAALALACLRGTRPLALAPLCVFWYARCLNSHAAEQGDVSLLMIVYVTHLGLISLWVGEVLVAGLAVLADGRGGPDDARTERITYVQALSDSATLALAGIFATGTYLAWHILSGPGDLVADPYGRTLLAKLACVGLAAAMGGYNRFYVMPALPVPGAAGAAAALRLRRVLRWEGGVLLAALALAAVLASSAPPGSGT